jgi:threonylcarbamoyladenosine tRNA methylthiotransferase MtaB
MAESLRAHGHQIVSADSSADVYIINTCVVTGRTAAQSRQLIRRVLRAQPDSRMVVTGCYAQIAPHEIAAVSDRVHIAGNREKDDMPAFISTLLAAEGRRCAVADMRRETRFTTAACGRFLERTRAFLKIQDGCNSHCSYCVVPAARGASRSLPWPEVHARLARLTDAGYREVVLTGIHLGAYGLDLEPRTGIANLLESLETAEGFRHLRIRLSSIEPTELTDELISVIARSPLVCHHVHVPLQSGDGGILRRMGRPYSPAFFAERISRLSAAMADVTIGIDVIAGFPGETEAQFQHTVELVQQIPAGYLHVFPYSRRPGTAAALLNPQVPERTKKERVAVLRRLSDEKKHRHYLSCIGRALPVLVENRRDHETGRVIAMARTYIPVLIEAADGLAGQEVMAEVVEVVGTRVFAKLVAG